MRVVPSHEARRGQVLILAVCVVIILCGMCAFTIDIGIRALRKAQLQNAADAAAFLFVNQRRRLVGHERGGRVRDARPQGDAV